MHRETSKNTAGLTEGNELFWHHLQTALCDYRAVVLTGTFNMSLFQVVPRLRDMNWNAELLSWYPWVQTAEEDDSTAPADAGKGQIMFDGLGIFTLHTQCKMTRALDLEDLKTCKNVPRWAAAQGQGYPIDSFLGGMSALEQSFRQCESKKKRSSQNSKHDPVRNTKSKLLDPKQSKALKRFFREGGHMPLLAYFGNTSRRSEGALQRREKLAQKRGYGSRPGGKRSWDMQRQGKGPAPASAAAEWPKGHSSRYEMKRDKHWSKSSSSTSKWKTSSWNSTR